MKTDPTATLIAIAIFFLIAFFNYLLGTLATYIVMNGIFHVPVTELQAFLLFIAVRYATNPLRYSVKKEA